MGINIYIFYITDFGTKAFTIDNVHNMYDETKRKSASRRANLSNNIKAVLGKNYISVLNDNEYVLTVDGKHQAVEILTRTHSSSPVKSLPKKKNESSKSSAIVKSKTKANRNKLELLKDLNLKPRGKESLIDFCKKYNLKSNHEKIIVIIYYLNSVLELNEVTINHIYTGLWELNVKIPPTLSQIIINIKNNKGWLKYDNQDNIELSVQGMNTVKFDLSIEE